MKMVTQQELKKKSSLHYLIFVDKVELKIIYEGILVKDNNIDDKNDGLKDDFIDVTLEEGMMTEKDKIKKKNSKGPKELFIFPLVRRPFFPGMAAPILVEKGMFYEVLKIVAKTSHKCIGLFLTKDENSNIYKIGLKDLHGVGVLARIMRIIPLEQGGAQIVLSMEKRIFGD